MKVVLTAILSLAVLLAAGCNSSGSSDNTPSASATAAATAQPTVTIPARPGSLADYPEAIAGYATTASGAVAACFSDVYAAWMMPSLGAERACRAANTDTDRDTEIVIAVSADVLDPLSGVSVPSFLVAVLDPIGTGYVSAFQSTIYPLPADAVAFSPILDAGDLNGDGSGEFAFASQFCGETACLDLAYILEGTSSGYETIGPRDGIGIAEGAFEFVDEDGDGAKELLATGGSIATAESGPQRPRTEVWAWDGNSYALRETRPGASRYLYHHILDGDALLQSGEYADATETYQAALADGGLLLWKPEAGEREELQAYALFRIALAHLLGADDEAAANKSLDEARSLTGTLHQQLAAAFQAGYAAKGEIGAGCAAVQDDLRLNEPEYAAFWDFGSANPDFDPRSVCPF